MSGSIFLGFKKERHRKRRRNEAIEHSQEFIIFIAFTSLFHRLHRHKAPPPGNTALCGTMTEDWETPQSLLSLKWKGFARRHVQKIGMVTDSSRHISSKGLCVVSH